MINMGRLRERIELVNSIGRNEEGGHTRLAFSDADKHARLLMHGMMEEAGLQVRQDAAGNLLGSYTAGLEPTGFVATGSHIDTVLGGGPFDGLLGSIAAIEVLQSAFEHEEELRRPLQVIVFSDEEGARFGSGMIGSKAIAGQMLDAPMDSYVDKDGVTLPEALQAFGIDPQHVMDAKASAGTYSAFVELHIEQSIVLEQNRKPIGIVNGIKGPYWMRGSFVGESNHAGGTPMHLRRDALAAAAEFASNVNRIARDLGDQFVATVGVFDVVPGGINTIPCRVDYTVDIRDLDMDRRAEGIRRILNAAAQAATAQGVEHRWKCIKNTSSASMSPRVVRAIEEVCRADEIPYMHLPSGAFHDTLSMSSICDVGMVFVPSIGGVSHSPHEDTSWEDIRLGANVLYRTVVNLAQQS